MKTERRKHFRARPRASVFLRWEGVDEPVLCHLENAGGGGLFLRATRELPQDQPISVSISPGLGEAVFALAEVTRGHLEADGFRYALTFIRIESDDKLRLFKWLSQDILEG